VSHLRLRLAVVAAALTALAGAGNALASSSGVVISQVYGGGGNAGATYTNDYIELFNSSSSPVSLTGWSVQYAAATGSTWAKTDLSGSIAPGRYYLVQESQGAGGTTPLPTPDATGTITMAATAGKVALVTSQTLLSGTCPTTAEDFVGFGTTANCFEGAVGPTPAPSNTLAVLRTNSGATDTNNNASDFATGAPNPRNSATVGDSAPSVTSTIPVDGATGVAASDSISITFSEPVNVVDPWFTISCPISSGHAATMSGGPTTFTLDPVVDFATGETCTVSIAAASVSDQDVVDPPNTMAGNYTFSFTTGSPPTAELVISEVYGGGGNAGATLTHDFIELYNPTASSVSLAGWSVQYASSAGTTWQVTPLTGSIPAGRNYLVQEAPGTGGTTPLPTPDATGTIPMAAGSGKVVLVSTATALSGACPTSAAIADLVGYGAANCFEGTGPTAVLSNTTSAQRKGGGTQDTDVNADDFAVGAPDPHSSADQAPSVTSTTPTGGAAGVARDANVTIVFSEPVNVAGSWFTISCATSGAHSAVVTGGPTTFTLDPDADFALDESCTVTVVAANVTDQDANDPPDAMTANHAFSFQTVDIFTCGDPATAIHAVQGSGTTTPLSGSAVTIEGIVGGDYQGAGQFNGYYVQEETGDEDADPQTSEGIFVFAGSSGVDVSVGDLVRVRGTAGEFVSSGSSLTQISSVNAVAVCSTGNAVPPTSVTLPVMSIGDLERFEGMRVHFAQTMTATEVFSLGRFGEISLSGVGRLYNPTAVASPGPAAQLVAADNNRSRIVLDDGDNTQNRDPTIYPLGGLSAAHTLRVGDSLPELTGVMDQRFGVYRIQPVGPIDFAATNPRPAAPAPVGGNLKIASFNVLNFFNGNGLGGGFPTSRGANTQFELDRQRAKEVSALSAMNADVFGLMEIENDSGANSALAELVGALNAAMGAGTYAYVDTGVIGTDEIKVALIYKPGSVTPVGDWKILTSAVDPRFIDTRNRPSLAQTFAQNSSGQTLTVVVNHLKSKGSDCLPDDPDTGDGSGNCNGTRTAAAAAMVDWLHTDPTGSGDPDFLLIGDMNSYTFETPITTFEAGGFTNLVRHFHGLTSYSYVFNGESGYLDHALATGSLADQVTGVTDWHINPDEPTVLDYNVEFKSASQVNTFYDSGPYRSSDHDPVVIGIQLNSAPTVDAGGPYTVAEGGSVGVTASGNDADGDTLTYAWDLDDDGYFDDATGPSATFSAATIDGPATRTVRVQVTDGEETAVDEATVNVMNVDPTATFNAPATVFAGFPFTLSLTGASDPAPADVLTYAFDCGDGGGYVLGAANSRSCPTTFVGTRSVGGKVVDDDGGFTEYHATVSVIVTYDSLCALTTQYSSSSKIAEKLCDDLAKAKGKKKTDIDNYIRGVEKESGKAFTSEEASILIALARQL
jgi:hypothetical protein